MLERCGSVKQKEATKMLRSILPDQMASNGNAKGTVGIRKRVLQRHRCDWPARQQPQARA